MTTKEKNTCEECNTLEEVLNVLKKLQKNEFVYVISSNGKYYVETDVSFIRHWEKILYRGSVKRVEKIIQILSWKK